MTVIVDATVPSDAFVLGQVLSPAGDLEIRLTRFVSVGNAVIPYVWVEDHSLDEFEAAIAADDRVEEFEAVGTMGDRHLYRAEWADDIDGFVQALKDHEVVLSGAVGCDGRWSFTFVAPDRERFSTFYDACRAEDIPLDIRRLTDQETYDPRYGLTEKQREALVLAHERGYFEVPKGATLQELSEELDISYQAVARRLDRGLQSLLEHTLFRAP